MSDNAYTVSRDDSDLQEFLEEVVKAKPVFELREMLSLHTSELLKKLARIYNMKNYASSRKSQIIDYLYTRLSDSSEVASILMCAGDEAFAFFEKVASSKKVQMTVDEAMSQPYGMFTNFFFIEIYHHQGKIIFVAPDTVKKIYRELCKTTFLGEREQYFKIHFFATAFTSIYGFVDIDEFIAFINSHTRYNVDFEDMIFILDGFVWEINAPYQVFFPYVVHEELGIHTVETQLSEDTFEESNEEVGKIESLRGNTPAKPLSPEEIFRYTDPYYFEMTPAHEKLYGFLLKQNPDLANVSAIKQRILSGLNRTLARTDSHEISIPFIDMRRYKADEDMMKTLRNLYNEVEKHTRKWSKNGWMQSELKLM